MTRDELTRMARAAGFSVDEADFIMAPQTTRAGFQLELERFARLVAAAEREACAVACEGLTGRSYEFDMGRLHSAAAIRSRSGPSL